MGKTITRETKKEGQKKPKRQTTHKKFIKRKKLDPFVVGSYFPHNPSNVACMQIMKSNSNESVACMQIMKSNSNESVHANHEI
jgi:hypothetical protein